MIKDMENKIEIFKEKLAAFNNACQDLDNFMQYSTGLDDSFAQDYPFDCQFDEISIDVKKWVQSASDHCPSTQNKASLNQSVDFKNLNTINWILYDDIEIHPCIALDKDGKNVPWEALDLADHMEQVEKDNENITCWSVYAHLKEGGIDSIGDFKDKPEAEHFAMFIMHNFLSHANKKVAFSLDCTVGKNANVDALMHNIIGAITDHTNCMSIIKDFDINAIE